MNYVLVNEDCRDCRYITDAFSLLRLPLQLTTAAELNQHIRADTIAVIIPHMDNAVLKPLKKALATHHTSVIVMENVPQLQDNDIIYHVLQPSFSYYDLNHILHLCANHKTLPASSLKFSPACERLIGQSDKIVEIRSLITQVADADVSVLILGQSGVGKDVIASCIHQSSGRRAKPFIPINCGAIPSELIESELFGHEKGAFTGAGTRRIGRFEIANQGTLFLDEIGDMPLQMQVKLLRVLQEKTIERVGGSNSIPIDVRLIAATHKNLEQMIIDKTFREDLYYRINVFPIHVPSLHDRQEDIPLLIDHYVEIMAARLHHRVSFTQSALDMLCAYPWPGNIRELQNFLERIVILFPDQVVNEQDIEKSYPQKKSLPAIEVSSPFNIKHYIESVERSLIQTALEKTNGMASSAAEYLSMGKNKLMEKMKKYGLASESS